MGGLLFSPFKEKSFSYSNYVMKVLFFLKEEKINIRDQKRFRFILFLNGKRKILISEMFSDESKRFLNIKIWNDREIQFFFFSFVKFFRVKNNVNILTQKGQVKGWYFFFLISHLLFFSLLLIKGAKIREKILIQFRILFCSFFNDFVLEIKSF